MKLRHVITLSWATVVALGSTGCVIREGGFRVSHQPPPPPVYRAPEVVVVTPPRAAPPPPRVVVRPVVVHAEPPPVAPPPTVIVTAPRHTGPPPRVAKYPETPAGPAATPNDHFRTPPGLAKKEPSARPVVVFTTQEREIIHTHLKHSRVTTVEQGPGKKHKGLPPGLAKKAARGDDLPPGWQKRCVVGEVMPQEIYRQCEPLPQEVVVKLPPPPPDTIVVTIDAKVVRLARATLEILDIFDVL